MPIIVGRATCQILDRSVEREENSWPNPSHVRGWLRRNLDRSFVCCSGIGVEGPGKIEFSWWTGAKFGFFSGAKENFGFFVEKREIGFFNGPAQKLMDPGPGGYFW